MGQVLKFTTAMNEWIGKSISYLIWIGIFMLCFEVVSRYLFQAPTVWAHGWSQRIFGSYFVLVGAYTLLKNGHVRIDLITSKFSSRINKIFDLINYAFLLFWVVFLLKSGGPFFWRSWQLKEVDEMALAHPVYPFKFIMLVGIILIMLQAISFFSGTLISLIKGEK